MIIKLYNEQDQKIVFNNPRIIDSGTSGTLYRLDEGRILKYITSNYHFDVTAIKDINKMNLPNFGRIYEFLYDSNYQFSGYITEYYKKQFHDILTMPTEYSIENLYQIKKSFVRITKAGILVKDLHDENIILGNDLIRIIDYDRYERSSLPEETLTKYNYAYLMYLFRSLYISTLIEYHGELFNNKERINKLFEKNAPLDEIYKKLVRYKYPIDYVK